VEEEEEDIHEYYVRLNEKGWICSCCGIRKEKNCIHILFIKKLLSDSL
jgi:hypothetical protein